MSIDHLHSSTDSFCCCVLLFLLKRVRRNVVSTLNPLDVEGSGFDMPLFNGTGNRSAPSETTLGEIHLNDCRLEKET